MRQEECVPSTLGLPPCSDMNRWGPSVCLRANKNEVIVLKIAQGLEQSSPLIPSGTFTWDFGIAAWCRVPLVGPHLGPACA